MSTYGESTYGEERTSSVHPATERASEVASTAGRGAAEVASEAADQVSMTAEN